MADFSALKTSIQDYIKQNGNEEITGNLLQQILLSMVSTLGDSAINDLVIALNNEVLARQNADGTLQTNIDNEATARGNADTQLGNRITSEAETREGADNTLRGLIDGIIDNIENGYVYAGIATPSTTPASGKVFYIALTAGEYTNFGATVVQQGINILKYNGSAWSADMAIAIDDQPTDGSGNLVKSGGVYLKINQEKNRAEAAEGTLQQNINAEKNRAEAAENTLQQNITVEKNRAEQAEGSLHQEIESEEDKRKQEIQDVRDDVFSLIHNYQPIVIEGNVVNAPDEEDITQQPNNLLKFKDKAYNPTIFSGLGRKYLRKNVVINEDYVTFDGFLENPECDDMLVGTPDAILWARLPERFVAQKDDTYYLDWEGSEDYIPVNADKIYVNDNIPYTWNGEDLIVDDNLIERYGNTLTQEMMSDANTIYVIQYDFVLGEDITVPTNCILEFDGGSINGNYTVTFNNTEINGINCFGEDVSFAGNILNNIVDLRIFKNTDEPFECIGKLLGNYSIYDHSGQPYNMGKTFVIPRGTYTISKGLSILGCVGVTIECSGSIFIDTISEVDGQQYWTKPMIWICDSSDIVIKNMKYKYSTLKQLDTYNSGIISIGARGTIMADKLTHNISIINFEGDGTDFVPSSDDNYGLTAIGALGEIQNISISECKWVGPITAFANFEWSNRGSSTDNYYGLRPNNIYINNVVFEDVSYSGRCKCIRFSSAYNIYVSNVYAYNCDRTIMFANGDWGIARTHQVAKFDNIVHKNVGDNLYGDCFYFLTLYANPEDDTDYADKVNRYPVVIISNCITEGLLNGILINNLEGNITVNNSIFEKCNSALSGYVAYNRGMLLIENSTFLKCNYAVNIDDMSYHIKDSVFTKDENRSNRVMAKVTNAARFINNRTFIIEGCEFNTEGNRNNVDIEGSVDAVGRFKYLIIKDNIFKTTSQSYPAVKCTSPLYTYFYNNKGEYITSNEYNVPNFNSDNCNIDLIDFRGEDENTEIVLDTRYGVNYRHGRSTAIIKGIRTDDYIEEVKITKTASGNLTIMNGQTIPNGFSISTVSGNDEVISSRCSIVLRKPYPTATFYTAYIQQSI